MNSTSLGPLIMRVTIEQWPLSGAFRTAAQTLQVAEVIVVTLERGGHVGRGEAAGVYYRDEVVASIARQIEILRSKIEGGVDRESLQRLLPPGGARNALDCAWWDLEAKISGHPAWRLAGLTQRPQPLITLLTCGADEPENMALAARRYTNAKAIKLKLTGELIDAERVRAVREARPDVSLTVDANQGFTRPGLERLMPALVAAQVMLVEQPFPIGQEALLDGLASPIPIVADESAQCATDIPPLVGRFDVVNIKLDKAGGLTEGLAMARMARAHGLQVYIGNMFGTSLAIAPAYLLGQVCDFVELDGPAFLQRDRANAVSYVDGAVACPDRLWGYPE